MNDMIQGMPPTLVVGFDEVFSALVVGRLLSLFAAENPAARLRVERGPALDINEGVLNKTIAVGVGLMPRAQPDMEFRPLYSTSLVAAVPDTHRFASRANLHLREFTSEKMVLLTKRHLQRVFLEDALVRQGLELGNTLEISHVDEVLSCVREGLGLSVLFREAIQDAKRLRKIPVADLPPRYEIGCYFLKGDHGLLVRFFIEAVEAAFRDLNPDPAGMG